MNIYIIVWMAIQLIVLGVLIPKHGKPTGKKHNTWVYIISMAMTWPIYLRALGVL